MATPNVPKNIFAWRSYRQPSRTLDANIAGDICPVQYVHRSGTGPLLV